MKTVVGLVAGCRQAEELVQKLTVQGFKIEDIIRIGMQPEGDQRQRGEEGSYYTIEEFFGTEEKQEMRGYYAEGVRRGGVLVSLFLEDEDVDRAAEIMIGHGAMDIERPADFWKKAGSTGLEQTAGSSSGGTGRQSAESDEILNTDGAVRGKVSVYDHSAGMWVVEGCLSRGALRETADSRM